VTGDEKAKEESDNWKDYGEGEERKEIDKERA